MRILHLFRFLKSYVLIRVKNGFTERFINLCSQNRIPIWNVAYHSDGITANISATDFKKLRKIRKKAGVDIKIIEKTGITFLLRKNRCRYGIIYGAVFSLIAMFVMNLFIWDIDVSGSVNLSKEQVRSVAEELGLRVGAFSPLFDESDAARKAVGLLNGKIIWMSINIKGSKASVEVRDYVENINNDKTDNAPCNYIADFEGILTGTRTFSGEQKAFIGDTVKKGSLLISGICENTDGSVSYIQSDGEFTAQHNKRISVKYSLSDNYKKIIPEDEYCVLEFMHIKIPTSYCEFTKNPNKLSYTKYLSNNNRNLPVGIKKTVVTQTKEDNYNSLKLIDFIDNFTQKEYRDFADSLITDSNYNIYRNEMNFEIICDYDCIDYIGTKTKIIKEN